MGSGNEIANFSSIPVICPVLADWRLKTKENFKLLALKVVMVAYERWSLTRGSKYSDLTWKLGKLVTEERWSLKRGGHIIWRVQL